MRVRAPRTHTRTHTNTCTEGAQCKLYLEQQGGANNVKTFIWMHALFLRLFCQSIKMGLGIGGYLTWYHTALRRRASSLTFCKRLPRCSPEIVTVANSFSCRKEIIHVQNLTPTKKKSIIRYVHKHLQSSPLSAIRALKPKTQKCVWVIPSCSAW